MKLSALDYYLLCLAVSRNSGLCVLNDIFLNHSCLMMALVIFSLHLIGRLFSALLNLFLEHPLDYLFDSHALQ